MRILPKWRRTKNIRGASQVPLRAYEALSASGLLQALPAKGRPGTVAHPDPIQTPVPPVQGWDGTPAHWDELTGRLRLLKLTCEF